MTEKPIFGIFNDRNYKKQLGHNRLLTDTYVDYHATPNTSTSLRIPAKKKGISSKFPPSLSKIFYIIWTLKVQLFHVNTYTIHIWYKPASIRQNQQLKWNILYIPSSTEGRMHTPHSIHSERSRMCVRACIREVHVHDGELCLGIKKG